jgi:hypothetical protein
MAAVVPGPAPMRAIANCFHTIKETLGEDVRKEIKLPMDFEDYFDGGKPLFHVPEKEEVKIRAE